ncbi:MAG: aminotransferase class I/II-fold pyridoxal phosphate-dependent enzyme [bacterium]|nr:aminotransferase class I/II-fold pyridoxal phosphate-dependent enzyme [bacterium]
MQPSHRSSLVKYAIRDVVLEAKKEEAKGKEVIYLNIGDPAAYDFSPPQCIMDATKEALDGPYKGYAFALGEPKLREEVARIENCSPDEVFVTAGLSEGIDHTMKILLDPGDSILLPNPTYPLYSTKAQVLFAQPLYYGCRDGWIPDPDEVRKKISDTTKSIVIINPNNPTGAVYPYNVLKELADIAAEYKLTIIADEVYDHVIFDDVEMHKMKDIAKDCVVFSGNSLSKNFLYPGARIGYMAIHNDTEGGFKDAFTRLCNQRLSVNWEFQFGAIAAYKNGFDFLKPSLDKLRKRRDVICKKIDEIPGLSIFAPQAALYGFVKVEGYKGTDWEFVYDLLRTEGVLVVPGSAFYKENRHELYFRTTLLPDDKTLEIAMNKLEKFMKARIA